MRQDWITVDLDGLSKLLERRGKEFAVFELLQNSCPAEIQLDLDRFLEYCNLHRSHQGYRLAGRNPAQALREALGREELPPLVAPETITDGEEVTSAA